VNASAVLVTAACAGDMRTASRLVADEPGLARADLYTACVTGESETVAGHLRRDAGLARARGGPLDREPLLYACFSRFLRTDRERTEGIVQIVGLLLEHGADPGAHFLEGEGPERQPQTALFGAAGIANHPRLTRLLLQAGADADEGLGDPGDGISGLGPEALYHASEFPDISCLRLLLEARPHPRRVSYCLGRMLDFDNPAGALLYLEHHADPDFRVPWHRHRTHLHKAAGRGRALEVIARMIEHGADVNALDDDGVSVYRQALRFGHLRIAGLL
jgi:hypothetical protein